MKKSAKAILLENRRLQAIELLEHGFDARQVAQRLRVHPRSVQRWRTRHQSHGDQGLAAKPAPGRPTKLSHVEKIILKQRLGDLVLNTAHAGERLAYKDIAKLISNLFSKEYNSRYIGRLLRSLKILPPKVK